MTVKLNHEIAIKAPVDRVWAVLANLQGVSAYNPGIVRAEVVTENTEGTGAARVCTFRDGGTCRETVTEWRPGVAMTIEMSEHPWPMKAAKFRVEIEPDGRGTMLKQVTEYIFAGDPAIADGVRGQWDQVVGAVLDAFRQHVEKGT